MIIRIFLFIFRSLLGVIMLIGSLFIAVYAIVWDSIRTKILAKKPIDSICYEGIINSEIQKLSTVEYPSKKQEEVI